MITTLYNLDWSILNGIHSTCACSLMDFVMPKVTLLGNAGFIWLVAAFLLLIRKQDRPYGVMLLAGLVICFFAGNLWLKSVFARPRPCQIDTGIPLLIARPADYSFPSGHTLSAFLSATIIARWRGRAGVPAFILAGLIAFSRLYLYVHFPSDILGGAILGILTGQLVFWAITALFRRWDKYPFAAKAGRPFD